MKGTCFRREDRPVILTLILLTLLSIAPGEIGGQESFNLPGLEVGATVPAFSLPDPKGEIFQIHEHLKKNQWTAVLFYRSADW